MKKELVSDKTCIRCNKPIPKFAYYTKDGQFKGYGQYKHKKYCSKTCSGLDIHQKLRGDFWSRLSKTYDENACWEYRGVLWNDEA